MTTLVFKTIEDFFNREDQSINGVSEDYAAQFPEFKEENITNKGCWNCLQCMQCVGCENCFYCEYSHYCIDCVDCDSCLKCVHCYGIFNKKNGCLNFSTKIPSVKNLNKKVFDAVNSQDERRHMARWHSDATNIWAGWIITIAGEKGEALKDETCAIFAALMIFNQSNEYSLPVFNFHTSNEIAKRQIEAHAQ